MPNIATIYDALADLLTYPDRDFAARLQAAGQSLASFPGEAAGRLERFAEKIAGRSTTDMEELFTQAFDLNPICSLEVGWHLFGEQYARGEFLVEMRQTLRQLHLTESTELPDHLTHVLRALGRMPQSQGQTFAGRYVLKALDKMLTGMRGQNCPYEEVLEAARAVVLSPYGVEVEEVVHVL